ncbi:TPA: hypothetical protein R5X24_001598 [Campylobacter coli]|nr:hypothetical protein [Campylobacter coli]HED6217496.1 hypothetical protein [Campylobacter coli]HED6226655.1 hypothetical protein [Campylobacter coli]
MLFLDWYIVHHLLKILRINATWHDEIRMGAQEIFASLYVIPPLFNPKKP